MKTNQRRPVFFNLMQIRMPVGAVTSIAHRVSGILLAFGTPFLVYLLDSSLRSQDGYERIVGLSDRWYFRAAVVVSVWSLAHHLLAGIRHLASDIDVGSRLLPARRSAWIVNVGGLVVAMLAVAVMP
jgi:succinate dehydrogenase / fumarate reductase cytochrome b subunit